jgi:hypothetical protein
MSEHTREGFEMLKQGADRSKWRQPRTHKQHDGGTLCGNEAPVDRLRGKWSKVTCKKCIEHKPN